MGIYDSLDSAVESVVELSRGDHLGFTMYQIGPEQNQIDVVVDRFSLAAATQFFAELDPRWPNGTLMKTNIKVRAAGGWVSEPTDRRSSEPPDPAALVGLEGLDVNEAALRANAGRWVVRAFEPQAVITADLRSNRANLLYDESGTVLRVSVG